MILSFAIQIYRGSLSFSSPLLPPSSLASQLFSLFNGVLPWCLGIRACSKSSHGRSYLSEVTCTRAPWGVGQKTLGQDHSPPCADIMIIRQERTWMLTTAHILWPSNCTFYSYRQKQSEIRPKVVYHCNFYKKKQLFRDSSDSIKRRMAIKIYIISRW